MNAGGDLFRPDLYGGFVGGEVGGEVDLLIVAAVGLKVVDGYVPVVPHAAKEDVVPGIEAAHEALNAVMPLADLHGVIAVFEEGLAHGDMLRGNVAAAVLQMEEGLAGVNHGPGGHTHRGGGAAGDVGVDERGARVDQPVHVGGLDFVVSKGVDGPVTLIVCQQEENIGLFTHNGRLTLV